MLPVVLPEDARRIEDADEEIFFLYSQLQASGSVSAQDLELGGLGFVDSTKGELFVEIDVTPPSGTMVSNDQLKSGSKRTKKDEKLYEPLEITLFQDTTALRSRQGDTGSVLWRASVHLARLLLVQQRFPPSSPFLLSAALSTCHVLELGSGTGLLSIMLAPHVARYTATDLPSLVPLIRKNQARNLAPEILAKVAVEDLDWVQLHASPARARHTFFTLQTTPLPTKSPSSSLKSVHGKTSASAKATIPDLAPRIDLILVVDCIYNPSLIAPLLSTIDCVSGTAPVLVVLELRAANVTCEFLERWLALPGWEVWSVPLLGPRFAMWVGKRKE